MSVYQPWDKLKACLVGRSYPPEFYDGIKDPAVREPMQRVARETEEDYQKLISKLEEFDVEVVRLDLSPNKEDYENHEGVVDIPPPMCPRDFSASIGNKFYMPSKNWGDPDTFNFEQIYWDMMNGDENAPWRDETRKLREETLAKYIEDLLLPGRPISMKESYDSIRKRDDLRDYFLHLMSGIDVKEAENLIKAAEMNTIGTVGKFPAHKKYYPWGSTREWLTKNNIEIAYDTYINTASCWRIGKDLYFNYVNVLNKLNQERVFQKWTNLFPEFRVHGIDIPGHGDGAMCPVCPGLIIGLSPHQFYKASFPGWEIVQLENQSWAKVQPFLKLKEKNRGRWWIEGEEDNQELIDYVGTWLNDWVTYVEESVFDVNMLSIDEHNIICNGYNKEAFDAFERYGVTPHIVNFRHRYFWDGGLHCITSDLSREGTMNDYFPERS